MFQNNNKIDDSQIVKTYFPCPLATFSELHLGDPFKPRNSPAVSSPQDFMPYNIIFNKLHEKLYAMLYIGLRNSNRVINV
jgi:hypothetical protein